MVSIEIDGIQVEVRTGAMVIEAADQIGIKIPRFCYHKKLSIAANCRMCLVEVEKAPKPMPACATPVADGMKVFTRSPKAISGQKATMEFLLINHPLDCPICDQGGECELQDVAVGFGNDASQYGEQKRVVPDPDLGALISTDMNRCIHCTRCVRFGAEVAGLRELGATGRGEFTKIGTFVAQSVDSEISGNVIDLCPVGALTSKPFRFNARAWEMSQHPSIAPHDSLGSNMYLHAYRNRIVRTVPRENETVNEVWLSDRDRFGYEGLYSDDRLLKPMIKKDGAWSEVDWDEALETATFSLKAVVDNHGADQLGCLVSPSATLEEMYLSQKLMRELGSNNIDHRLRQADFSDQEIAPNFPGLGQSIDSLETLDAALLIGSNLHKEQPLLAVRLRKAALAGAGVSVLNPIDFNFNFPLANRLISSPATQVAALASVAAAVVERTGYKTPAEMTKVLQAASADESHNAIAQSLIDGGNCSVLLGNLAVAHPEFSTLRGLALLIARATGANMGYMPEAANSVGGWVAGAVPHRLAGGEPLAAKGRDLTDMLANGAKGFLLIGVEPLLDCQNGQQAQNALQAADTVVAISGYRSESLEAAADIMLPLAGFAETSGTFINATGESQSFAGAVPPQGEARPGWKILRVLGNLLDLSDFDYFDSTEIREELAELTGEIEFKQPDSWQTPIGSPLNGAKLTRLGEVPLYAANAIVRRARSLQKTADAGTAKIRINSDLASQTGLASGETAAVVGDDRIELPVVIDDRVPTGTVSVPAGLTETAGLGSCVIEVTLEKAKEENHG